MKKEIILFISITLVSCGPLDKEYNKTTVQQDLKEIREGGIAETDIMLLDYYIESQSASKGVIQPHTTYKQLLEQAKIYQMRRTITLFKNEDEIAIKGLKEKERIDSLKKNLAVSLLSKEYLSLDGKEEFLIKINILNNFPKEIKAIKGILEFNDVFNENIKKIEMKCEQEIKTKQMITYAFRENYNPLLQPDINLLNTDTESIQFNFIPQLILFNDGSSKRY
jgi:hypothetical protein